MRIVDRQTFLQLPAGTVYAKCADRWVFGDICVKYDTWGKDWLYQNFTSIDAQDSGEMLERYEAMADEGRSFPLDTDLQRDGMYQDDALFLIYEPDDVRSIVAALTGGGV